jgi:ubiquinone/menaquinone biosynthesis C-methylase UbiE
MHETLKSIALLLCLLIGQSGAQTRTAPAQGPSPYEVRADHDPNGIGKFYLGREIARVMGHEGADWLERPDRIDTERPAQVIAQMRLRPTDVVADIGAGTGYFTFRISPRVPRGRVYAVDIQPEMLELIEARRAALKADRVVTIRGTETDVNLPADSVDVALLVDAYHEFSHPREMMASIRRSLKPGGRLILIEYRGEDPDVPIKPIHKMTVAQARREMEAAGLVWKETRAFLPLQHFIVFAK